MRVAWALLLLVVLGFPLVYGYTRDALLALVASPLVAALVASVAVMGMLAVGGPFAVWIVGALVASSALAVVLHRRPRADLPRLALTDVAVMIVPLLLPLLAIVGPLAEWDTRSIWWFHASWFSHGGSVAGAAMGDPAFAFSHPDYPPLLPATVALAWLGRAGPDYPIARFVSTVVVVSAISLLAFGVRHLGRDTNPWLARLVGLGVALSVFRFAPEIVSAGMADHLWATAIAGGAVLLLVDRVALDERAWSVAAAVLVATAALSKNEGFIVAAILVVLFALRSWRAGRGLRPLAAPAAGFGLGLLWALEARWLGATSDLTSSGRTRGLLHLDPEVLDRARPTLEDMWSRVGGLTIAAAVVAVIGSITVGRVRRRLGWGSDLWLWVLTAGYAAALLVTYLISPYEIDWHLATSLYRTIIGIAVLLFVSVAGWLLVALSTFGRTHPGGRDERAHETGTEPRADREPMVDPVG